MKSPSIKVGHVATVDTSLRYLLLDQLRSIKQAGYDIFGISAYGHDVPAIREAGIVHIAVPMTRRFNPLFDLFSLFNLYRIIRRERFTIIHTHTPKPGLLGQIAAKRAGVPIIVNTIHGFYFHDNMNPTVRRFYISLEKIAALCSDLVFSQNKEDIETAVQENICPRSKIMHLGNGIDLERFNPMRISGPDSAAKKGELGIDPSAKVVGFAGRLVKEKGILELFAAGEIVSARTKNVHFIVIGPEDLKKSDALKRHTISRYKNLGNWHLLGERQDMPELYSLMDVLVLASHREGFPKVVLEASAMKVPCVVTNVRGCREAVEHGRNGLIVPLGDIQALAEAILGLLLDREKACDLGEEGRRMAVEQFDEKIVFAKVLAQYERLLSEKGFSPPAKRPLNQVK